MLWWLPARVPRAPPGWALGSCSRSFNSAEPPGRADARVTRSRKPRYEFEDTRYRLRNTPEMCAVLMELYVQSLRNPPIAQILDTLERQWSSHLIRILERGVRSGLFRRNLDLAGAATMVMVQMEVLAFHVAVGKPPSAQVDRLINELADDMERRLMA